MRAEILKVRSLPTPFWCLMTMFACFTIGLIISFFNGIGAERDIIDAAIGLPSVIASIVFGVWLVGVEYGQKTLRQVLTADPRRVRLIVTKLALIVIVVLTATVFFHALSYVAYSFTGGLHDQKFVFEDVARSSGDSVFSNIIYAFVGASLALLTASMAGGMTMTLVFVFVLDTIFTLIPKVGKFSFGQATGDVSQAILGTTNGFFSDDSISHTAPVALLIIAAWLGLILFLGLVRLRASEVK